ncbi:phenylacetate--CoA ligase family protein [Marinobacter sp.]|uniref:phenylacetate--CoA ligase family protein n=1 Tax=Marinobacter sp. TaxID=50741 RepID=UPI003A8EB7D4
MHRNLSKLLFYYPATMLKGEPIAFLLNDYRRNQWMPRDELAELQFSRCKAILTYAYKNSNFYRKLYDNAGIQPDAIKSLADFKNVPTISKPDLINNLAEMSVDHGRFSWSTKTTGGSTGQPVKLYKNPMALARERCATARGYEWAGLKIGDPQLRFWGVPHSAAGKAKAFITDLIANRKRVSAFDLTPDSLNRYYQEALIFKPGFIYGYVSVIEIFARHILENKLSKIPSVKSVITTSEILTDKSRQVISEAFGVSVFNEYGCGEVGSVAHECDLGGMHVMSDNVFLEVEEDGSGSGEIIVTDFYNLATPMIRYRLGDYATLSRKQCDCGRGFPILESIHGRAYDVLQMPSGGRVHPEAIIYVFEGIQSRTNAFEQFQVVQKTQDQILVRIIPNKNWSNDIYDMLIRDLKRDISSDINFSIDVVDEIHREKSGKLRLVKSEL